MCIAGGVVTICTMTFIMNLSPIMKVVYTVIICYIACLIMSISCIAISKDIINKYDLKFIK